MIPMYWAALDTLRYLPLILVGMAFLVYRLLHWQRAVTVLAMPMLENASYTRQALKVVLIALALIGIFLALLKPQWNQRETSIHQEGRDLFIALDISRSMLAQDVAPHRLAYAKRKIKRLLELLSSERVGLILFSGSTFVQCPLTADYRAFLMFLEAIDVETISSGTTAIDQAIMTAIRAFKAAGGRKNKLLVLFTDGEDFSSNLSGIKQEAAQEGLTIFAVGVGTSQGAPIPLLDATGGKQGHQRDKKGGVVISRLNEGILTNLAYDCGGLYIKMSDDESDLKALIAQLRRFEKERFEDKRISRYEEQYPYFIAISFICLLLEWLL